MFMNSEQGCANACAGSMQPQHRATSETQPSDDPVSAVDIYWTDLDRESSTLPWFLGTLSHDERERAARYRWERDRRRYIVRRGVLRELLSLYLHCPPAAIRLSSNP